MIRIAYPTQRYHKAPGLPLQQLKLMPLCWDRTSKLKQQTLSQLTTIMAQLEMICTLMEEQWQWQDQYNDYDRYDQAQPFSPMQSHMEEETNDQQNKKHADSQAAGSSTMEDTSMSKWDSRPGEVSPKPLDSQWPPMVTIKATQTKDKEITYQKQDKPEPTCWISLV